MPRNALKYLSVCSSIEAATVAWHELGWRPVGFSEIDAFARAVLVHHYNDVPLHGDFTEIKAGDYGAVDLLVGGSIIVAPIVQWVGAGRSCRWPAPAQERWKGR